MFEDFLKNLRIDSKEKGNVCLYDYLYQGQKNFLNTVCDGLDNGIHHFVVLKARQLGITTISIAMDLFWLMVHPGMQGGLIVDSC